MDALPFRPALALLAAALVWLLGAAAADAQELPSRPISLAGGRLVLGGEVSATIGPEDQGFFNYTDYELSALRLLRLSAAAEWKLAGRLALLGELRTENWDQPRAFALYLRVRPFRERALDVQIGRIPPTFGSFARRAYGAQNMLVGYPLAYQYLTSLRPDAVPASADDLLRMRGRGWRAAYPIGSPVPDHGVPLVSAFRWDTGAQVRLGAGPFEIAAAVTNGTLSNPRVSDDNGGKQISARTTFQPTPALVLGASWARGAFLSRAVAGDLPAADTGTFLQRSVGVDAEYSRDHWIVRGEAIFTGWELPRLEAPLVDSPLGAASYLAEGRLKLQPGLYVAARAERLSFSEITGSPAVAPAGPTAWDAPVTRFELGAGYYLKRNVIAKVSYQYNRRDDDRRVRRRFVAAQLHYWF